MTAINIDRRKVDHMVHSVLHSLSDTGAHPAEVVVALSECVGRVIASLDAIQANDIVKRELVDIAIKHMALSIEKAPKSELIV